ncbi:MAG: tyrosine-type recombinase/integrase [Chloroflexi bacterium]|nr:tyrosine-type recombinase/integrase [Chloroflexota bacterium]
MSHQLPLSERDIPDELPWRHTASFLESVGSRSLKTEGTYLAALRYFADWVQVGERAGFDLEQPWPLDLAPLTTELVLKFNESLRSERAQNTGRTYMAALLSFFGYLVSIDQLPPGLSLEKVRERLKRQRKTALRPSSRVVNLDTMRQQIPLIVDYYCTLPLPSPSNDPYHWRLSLLRDRALVMVLYSTAVRISEAVALDRKHVANGQAEDVLITGKGGRTRTIHFLDYAREAIQAYLAERTDNNPALFVSHSRRADSKRLTTRSVQRIVATAVAALGLDASLTPHDFRHFRATELLREGVPVEVVQEYLGHADISTTRSVYAPVIGKNIVKEWLAILEGPLERAAQLKEV